VKPKTKIKSKSNIMKRKLTNSPSLLTASAALVWAVAQAADKKTNTSSSRATISGMGTRVATTEA
jgi:hypothetical protein